MEMSTSLNLLMLCHQLSPVYPLYSFQEQETPSSSLFSSNVEEAADVEEIDSAAHLDIPDAEKFKLQSMLRLLE